MSDRTFKLLLVDDDPIFRLGLQTALQAYDDLQVVDFAETAIATMEKMAALETENFPNLVILELAISPSGSGLQLCQQLKKQFPNIAILLLTSVTSFQELTTAQALGVNGYCSKGRAISDIIPMLRQVASGQENWQLLNVPSLTLSSPQPLGTPKLLTRMRESGLQEIELTLAQVRSRLAQPGLSTFDWLFWTGRERELKTARWIVSQLLPVEVVVVSETPIPTETSPLSPLEGTRKGVFGLSEQISRQQENLPQGSPNAPSPLTFKETSPESPVTVIFNNTLAKLQASVANLTNVPLEIDILQPQQKQELLYLVLQNLQKILEEQRFLEINSEELSQRRSHLLRDVWQTSTLDFFVKYYPSLNRVQDRSIVDIIVQNAPFVQGSILEQIPHTLELFSYCLYESELIIHSQYLPADSPEAMARAELLLQNLIIQCANGVMQLLLNFFPEVEAVKHSLYDRQYLPTREIARFRNDLSWRYRLEYYIEQPRDIFESRYRLWVFNGKGIRKTYIYAPRQLELEQLQGVRWGVTMAWEVRDAVAPRLRAVVGVLGKGVVYFLTHVLGRAIGLVGRGIVQGIGNTVQEVRYGKNEEQRK